MDLGIMTDTLETAVTWERSAEGMVFSTCLCQQAPEDLYSWCISHMYTRTVQTSISPS
ncbi:MAG: hypothetical protein MZV63_25225 [Marinilabiliales bacterium]|nr:hypothetical protein [Marinilabiliales bacterium]